VAIPVRLRAAPAAAAAGGTSDAPHPTQATGEMEVTVWFTCRPGSGSGPTSTVRAVHRAVPSEKGVLHASLLALLAGPSDDERSGSLSSWFSPRTQGMLRSVTISSTGHAVVDFADLRPVIPGASSSAGSQLLLAELDATVFQFPTVRSVEYRIDGSCTDFNEWLQYAGCAPRTR
jgi:spore germination protein GerM